jgi:hypothetical protein
MFVWSRKFVLALALAVMPLQGIAATLSVLACHGDAAGHDTHAYGGHDHGASHQGQQHNDGGASGDLTYHLCCHHTVSGVGSATLIPAMADFSMLTPAPQPLHDLFLPDRPQRPPLA